MKIFAAPLVLIALFAFNASAATETVGHAAGRMMVAQSMGQALCGMKAEVAGYGATAAELDTLDSCIKEHTDQMKEAYKVIPDGPKAKEVKSAARNLFSAWTAWVDTIRIGASAYIIKRSPEAQALNKASADLRALLELEG